MRFFILILIFIPISALTQGLSKPVCISIYNNATMLPGGGDLFLTSATFHPGVTIGTEFQIKEYPAGRIVQALKLGYFYHRLSEHGIQLYTEFVYRKKIGRQFYLSPMFGGGYLHAIPDLEVFKVEPTIGLRDKNNRGRAQALASIAFETGWQPEKRRMDLFLEYQLWFQMPFVKSYVPILPNTSLHLGVRLNINRGNGGTHE